MPSGQGTAVDVDPVGIDAAQGLGHVGQVGTGEVGLAGQQREAATDQRCQQFRLQPAIGGAEQARGLGLDAAGPSASSVVFSRKNRTRWSTYGVARASVRRPPAPPAEPAAATRIPG